MAITEITGTVKFVDELPPDLRSKNANKFAAQWASIRSALSAKPNQWAAILRTNKNGATTTTRNALGEGYEVSQRRDLVAGDFVLYARYVNGTAPTA